MSFREKHTKYTISSIFNDVQFPTSEHSPFKKILTDIYKKTKKKHFLEEFLKCLTICLTHHEKSPNVERALDFAAEFAVSFCSTLDENENCPLLEGVFQFIFENHDCQTQLVRLRICQLMNRLLDNMGQDATVLEDTYNKIAENMLIRLKDIMTSVRTQAVYALHRLQSPSEPSCDIIAAFKFHMLHDPCHEVRRAVIQKIAPTKSTLIAVLTRMNDVKDSVRREAYTFINRLLIRQFTIKQRQLILESGLNDRSEVARDFVLRVLIPNWLKHFNYNYYEFLECIHVEKISETGIKVLKAIFEKQHDVVLESRGKDIYISNQKIPYDKLNIRSVIYWRALAEYVRPTDENDKYQHIFDQILPDLTPFCTYIRGYFFPPKAVDEMDLSETPFVPMSEDSGMQQKGNQSPNQSQNVDPTSNQSQNIDSSSTNINTMEIEESASNVMSRTDEPSINTSPETRKKDEVAKPSSDASPEPRKKDEVAQPSSDASPESRKKDEMVETGASKMHEPDEAVLVHLLEMCKVYDLADEMGRNNLRQMCMDLLQSSQVTQQSTVAVLAGLLDLAVPSADAKLSVMAEVVTELRDPLQAHEATTYVPDVLLMEAQEKKDELNAKLKELVTEMEIAQELADDSRIKEINDLKASLEEELRIMNAVAPHEPGRNVNNDPETLKKCLTIVVEILNKGKIMKMNPTLYSLMQNFIVPTLKLKIEGDGAAIIRNLALQALGIFCVLDVELAKEHIIMFCFNIAIESLSVTALKCVFDLLHVYGLSTFNVVEPDSGEVKEEGGEGADSKPNLVVLLMSLLNSESSEMRKTAVIGLCKLLIAGRIKSADLVSKLIQLWFNPIVESDPHIRQPLGAFFTMFAEKCPHAPQLLQDAFLPTLKELFKVEILDPMAEVDIESVANLITDFTRPGFNPHMTKDHSIHNQLAIQMCEEVLKKELEGAHSAFLLKVISHLELNFDLTTDINIIIALVSKIVKTVPKEDKMLCRVAMKLESSLQMKLESNKTVSTVNNTLTSETSVKSSFSRPCLLQHIKDSESDDEEPVEEEEEMLSQEESVQRTIVDESEMEVEIPATPETSSEEEMDDDSCPSTKDTKFLGFSEGFKGFGTSFKGFKEPSVPPAKTPAKATFKVPEKTPRKTPAKRANLSQTSTMTPVKTPTKVAKTPAKRNVKTPVKTPAKSRNDSSLSPDDIEMSLATPSSERVTRSSKKRKN